jgi:hypothetical protein
MHAPEGVDDVRVSDDEARSTAARMAPHRLHLERRQTTGWQQRASAIDAATDERGHAGLTARGDEAEEEPQLRGTSSVPRSRGLAAVRAELLGQWFVVASRRLAGCSP